MSYLWAEKLAAALISVVNFLCALPSESLLLHGTLRFYSSPLVWPVGWGGGGFLLLGNIFSFPTPSLPCDPSSCPESLCLFLYLCLLPYLILRRLACLLVVWGPLLSYRSSFVGVVLYSDEFFIYLWGGR